METQQDGLVSTRSGWTAAAAIALGVPLLIAILSGRLWLMALAQGYATFIWGAYLVWVAWVARRRPVLMGVPGVVFMAGAILLMGRLALDFYPK
jgi:hypothetical protein